MHFTKINVDKIGHLALEHHAQKLITIFGTEIQKNISTINATTTTTIDRKILGNIVFTNKIKLRQLETIVHPWMKSTIENTVKNLNSNYIIDATLLHHMKLNQLCSIVIVVHSPWILRVIRANTRDTLPITQVIARFKNQSHVPDKKYFSKTSTHSKIILNNISNSAELLFRGTYSSKKIKKELSMVLNGVKNGTTHSPRTQYKKY